MTSLFPAWLFSNEHPTQLPDMNWMIQPWVLVGQAAGYLVFMTLLRGWMKDRVPYTCNDSMKVYNLAQIIICSYMTHGLFWNLVDNQTNGGWVDIMGISLPNIFGFNNTYSAQGEWFLYVHYMSKFLDYFDTLFIVLKKKDRQYSFLHTYHHSTIGPIWGLLLFLGVHGGTVCFGALLNSFVHVLMYTHYFVTAIGYTNPFKKLLTLTQINQFYLCFSHAALASLGVETRVTRVLCFIQFFYQLSMMYLFTQFSKRTYKQAPVATDKKKDSVTASPERPASPGGPSTRTRAGRRVKATTD